MEKCLFDLFLFMSFLTGRVSNEAEDTDGTAEAPKEETL